MSRSLRPENREIIGHAKTMHFRRRIEIYIYIYVRWCFSSIVILSWSSREKTVAKHDLQNVRPLTCPSTVTLSEGVTKWRRKGCVDKKICSQKSHMVFCDFTVDFAYGVQYIKQQRH